METTEQSVACTLPATAAPPRVILSFDIEEHDRIEAAAGLSFSSSRRAACAERMEDATRWLLDRLGERGILATFYLVGEIARDRPALVKAIHRGGHEVGSHSWDHRRVHAHTPSSFREDLRTSKDILEQVTGEAVAGYRAPTFSVVRETAWALDELAEAGILYDSSIYPVRHDRYGVPDAPRAPFLAVGRLHALLELPPMTLRLLGANLPAGGGGYFRLFPLAVMERALRQTMRKCRPAVAMLYFHPWEFDSGQELLPLGRFSRWRTYVGIGRTRARFETLIGRYTFSRAVDVAADLALSGLQLPRFALESAGGIGSALTNVIK
jgi:polysaccharide deacetylase family protein (PEP-CTERM system associated)